MEKAKTTRLQEKEKPATIAIAREIFGERFIGREQLERIFNGTIYSTFHGENHQLPYSVIFLEELLQAAPSTLIYQPNSRNPDNGIRLSEFAGICKGMSPKSGGALLHTDQFDLKNGKVNKSAWFAGSHFSEFRKNTSITPNQFRIATDAEIPGTVNKSFIDQVIIVCDWIEKSFSQSITETMKGAILEIHKNFNLLKITQDNNPAEFMKDIVTYKFFRLFMESGLETLWRLVAYEQATGTKLLQNMYLRNNVVDFVNIQLGVAGDWDSSGSLVNGFTTRGSSLNLGLGFSCTGI